jgi:RNA polymerase sigma-70 factor (ECF subfamily)
MKSRIMCNDQSAHPYILLKPMEFESTIALEMNDESTMSKVKNGEVKKLDLLYRKHSGALFGFFYGMCQDASRSEDLVQEVFWRILRFRNSFNEQLSFKAWIYRIARNLYIDHTRQTKKQVGVELDSIGERMDPEAISPDQESVRKDDRDRLMEALEALPTNQREILVMARFKDLSFRSIGEILGCSEEAAKVRAFRAMQALRKIYLSKEGSE